MAKSIASIVLRRFNPVQIQAKASGENLPWALSPVSVEQGAFLQVNVVAVVIVAVARVCHNPAGPFAFAQRAFAATADRHPPQAGRAAALALRVFPAIHRPAGAEAYPVGNARTGFESSPDGSESFLWPAQTA